VNLGTQSGPILELEDQHPTEQARYEGKTHPSIKAAFVYYASSGSGGQQFRNGSGLLFCPDRSFIDGFGQIIDNFWISFDKLSIG